MHPFTPRLKSAAFLLASALLALGVLASAAAQDPPQQPAPAQPDQPVPAPAEQPVPLELQPAQPEVPDILSGEDVAQGVFVRDSAMAVDQFAHAARMERLRDWAKAADIYQEVITQYGDRLIADRMDAEGKVYQYASVGRAVQRKLAAWPPEGRTVYEQKFGTPARTLLDQAKQSAPADVEALQKVVRLYFITDAGRQAAMLLIDRHIADGSFASARRLSRELLEMHPALGEQRPDALLRGVIAAHFLGDDEQARTYAEELATQFAQATATVAGEQQNLAAVAQAALEAPPPQGVQTAVNGWPTFGGSDDRSRLGPALSSQIAPYVQDLPIPEIAPGDQPLAATQRRALASARESGQLTGIFPVAFDGALYWSDNVHIFAVALDSGLPLPGWLDTYGGGSELPAYALPGGGFVTPRGTASTPTVTDRYVLANMGLRDQNLYVGSGNPAVAEARMVCLDRLTGRRLWERKPDELEAAVLVDPALQADLAGCQFVGAPLVVADAVWTLARSDPMRIGQFEQCFLVSLDLETGLTRTITYLASSSGNRPMTRWRGPGNPVPEPTSILAYSDGLIYAPTDTGALAAVRAADGAVEWLNLYPRLQANPIGRRMGASRLTRSRTESQPFHASPVIVEGGRLFFKPPDAPQVFVWNAADGDEVARIDLSVTERIRDTERSRSVAGNTTLLKVIGDRMLTFGPQGVSCIDWTAVHGDQTALDATLWSSPVESANGEDSVMGRPAVTETQVLVPTRQHLRVIQLEDGRFVATYPTGGAEWAQNEEPGNVVVLQDQLVIAGPTRVNVYADSAVIRERLEAQVAQNPADATPLLRLAQIAFVSGDFDQTEERLRQAEQASAAAQGTGEADGSDGAAFASALGFAQTLSDRLGNALAPGSPTPQTVDRFFTLAEKFARTPAQNVRVRFARADFADTEGGPQRRVALLQEILSDPAWRQVPAVPDAGDGATGDNQSPRQAGEVARELLAQLIAQSGQQVYEQIERRAVQEVADAVAAADVEALGRLAEIYPNSTASATALSEAAKLLQAQGRAVEAASALRRLAARSDDPLAAWLTLAQIEASRPDRLDVAAGRMRRAARLSPEAAAPAIKLSDGTTLQGLTVEQAAFELTDAALAADAARVPDLRLTSDPLKPLFADQATSIAGIEALIVPIEGFERHDRLIAQRSDGTLAVFAFDQPEPVWSAPMDANAAQSAAWLPEGLLVWGASSIALLDAETGQARWRHASEVLSPGQLVAGRDSQRAVVAAGWRPARIEPEVESVGEEQQLRELQGRQQQQMVLREQLQRRNEQRQQFLDRARREGIQPGDEPQGKPDQPIIADALPVGGTIGVILGGKSGGAAGVDSQTGNIIWRAPLPEGALVELHGAGDYLAVHIAASRSLLNVLDLSEGSLVTRRSFELEGMEPLANFLITPENELIYATRRVLTAVDLERNPQQARFTVQAEAIGENGLAFGVSAGRGRMKVVGDRLLVLADPTQSGRRDALVINLSKGAPDTFPNPAGGEPHNLLLTAAESPEDNTSMDDLPPRLRAEQRARRQERRRDAMRAMAAEAAPGERIWTAGSSVYLTADRGLSAYDLKVPGRHWKRLNAQVMREFDPAVNVGMVIGSDDLLLFDQPQATPRRQIDEPVLRVTAFSRDRLPDGRESGQQRHEVELVPGSFGLDAPVGNYQAMNGGLAVLSESGRLLFLRGE